jgi:hypothetical protein
VLVCPKPILTACSAALQFSGLKSSPPHFWRTTFYQEFNQSNKLDPLLAYCPLPYIYNHHNNLLFTINVYSVNHYVSRLGT